jgi:hypothetical protein
MKNKKFICIKDFSITRYNPSREEVGFESGIGFSNECDEHFASVEQLETYFKELI